MRPCPSLLESFIPHRLRSALALAFGLGFDLAMAGALLAGSSVAWIILLICSGLAIGALGAAITAYQDCLAATRKGELADRRLAVAAILANLPAPLVVLYLVTR